MAEEKKSTKATKSTTAPKNTSGKKVNAPSVATPTTTTTITKKTTTYTKKTTTNAPSKLISGETKKPSASKATSATSSPSKAKDATTKKVKPTAEKKSEKKPETKSVDSKVDVKADIKPVAISNVKTSATSSEPTPLKVSPTKTTPSGVNQNKPSPIINPSKKNINVANKNQQIKKSPIIGSSSLSKPNVKEVDSNTIEKNILVEEKEDKKRKKKIIIIILIILAALVLIGVGIYLILSLTSTEIKFDIKVDSEVHTEIYDSNDNIIGHIKYLPGDTIDAKMVVTVIDESGLNQNASVYLRVKMEVYVDNNYFSGIFNPVFLNDADWTVGDDGYVYYNSKLFSSKTITVFNSLVIDGDKATNDLNGKSGQLVFTAEVLEGSHAAISQEWHTSPNVWRNLEKIKDF
ncbi:MAG: hypothetical protein E7359_02285 [Clostridiales bacterium]|nr:hypothetical protein [Clostridiales bacterium]